MALTKRQIDAAKYEGDGRSWCVLMDDKVPGFGLRVYPSGKKSFILRYRTSGGRLRLFTVGRYGVLTLNQARKSAGEALGDVLRGEDPAERRQEARKAETVAVFSDLYLKRHSKPHKRTWKEDERRIEMYIKPAFGSLALEEVSAGRVAALHADIGATAQVEANRVIELFRAIFFKAIKWGILPHGTPNPAAGFDKFGERSRERWVRPPEMPALLAAVNAEVNPYIRAAVWLLLLTGARKSEILRARWDDIDWDIKELRIPETKGGRAHVVPLSEPALAVLQGIPREHRNPYIICGAHKGQRLKDFAKPWRRIRKEAGLEDITIHDLRRTVGSWMASAGVSLHIVGEILGHTSPAVTRVYARLTEEAPRDALAAYAEKLAEVGGPLVDFAAVGRVKPEAGP